MKTALMVAEKPSLASSLANILSNGKNSSRKGKMNFEVIFSHVVNSAVFLEMPSPFCRLVFGDVYNILL